MSTKICAKCNTAKQPDEFYAKPDRKNGASYCKKCFNQYCINRWIEKKKKAIEYKGGKCLQCGLVDHYSVFAFHHRNPKEKDVSWNKLRIRSWDKIKLELDKCDLVCHNCHAKIHWDS